MTHSITYPTIQISRDPLAFQLKWKKCRCTLHCVMPPMQLCSSMGLASMTEVSALLG